LIFFNVQIPYSYKYPLSLFVELYFKSVTYVSSFQTFLDDIYFLFKDNPSIISDQDEKSFINDQGKLLKIILGFTDALWACPQVSVGKRFVEW